MSTATNERGHVPALTLGWRLRMSLADSGMSRAEMAAVLEKSEATITRWMHDKGSPPPSLYVKQWALVTRTDADWLESGVIPDHTPPQGGQDGQTGALAELTRRKQGRVTATTTHRGTTRR